MSAFSRLWRGETAVDFVGVRRYAVAVSIVLLVVTLGSLGVRGLDLGIDFRGGIAWEVPSPTMTTAEAKAVLVAEGLDVNGSKVQVLTSATGERRVRAQVGAQSDDVQASVTAALAAAADVDSSEVSVAVVSAAWGRSITEKAARALVVFFLIVSVYIAWRFEWRMAVAAFAAMVHDVALTVGIYSLLGFVITPATVVAFLTILGYSLYDTIVVFDRVQENLERFKGSRTSIDDVVNLSMNQVLMRSINTTITSVLPVVSLLVVGSGLMGAASLQEFSVALLVGMLLGTYSSIFVATPILAWVKGREPRFRGLVSRPGGVAELVATHAQASVPKARRDATAGSAVTREFTHPPRPRKKRRR